MSENPSTLPDMVAHLLLDDPQEWAAFGRLRGSVGSRGQDAVAAQTTFGVPAQASPDAVWESNVVLEGMHCTACALTIEDALRAVPGVEQVDVSAATHRARVVWRPSQVLPSQWMAAVTAL
jgi:Cu2+-exporting ATPase